MQVGIATMDGSGGAEISRALSQEFTKTFCEQVFPSESVVAQIQSIQASCPDTALDKQIDLIRQLRVCVKDLFSEEIDWSILTPAYKKHDRPYNTGIKEIHGLCRASADGRLDTVDDLTKVIKRLNEYFGRKAYGALGWLKSRMGGRNEHVNNIYRAFSECKPPANPENIQKLISTIQLETAGLKEDTQRARQGRLPDISGKKGNA